MTSEAQPAIFDRIYGCLIGGAIGDAMGAPTEDWHYTDIRQTFGRVERFLPQPARKRDGAPGQITDDTTLRHYMCLAILRKGGRITPDDYAAVWLSDLNPDRLFVTERIVLEKLKLGMNPWETGRGQPAADAAIMAAAPIGIVNAGDPAQAYQDGVAISALHQDGLERDAAGVFAAGVAAALPQEATVEAVLAAMAGCGSFETRRLLAIARDLAAESGDADRFTEGFYLRFLDRSFPRPADVVWDQDRTVSPTSREVLPAAAGLFALCEGDPARCILAGANFGRDADTICSVLGGLSGALAGARAIPADWIADSERANAGFFAEVGPGNPPDFRATAIALVETLRGVQRQTGARAATLERMLSA